MLFTSVCLFMAVGGVMCFWGIRSVQKQPQLGANIILHLTFSEAIKEHKSLGTWQGEGLIVIEEHSLFGGVAKRLDQN
jgi:hypothetical protein